MTVNTHLCRPDGPYIRTQSGRWFNFMAPKPEEMHLRDISFNLSHQVRFNGSCGQYSVAEHCIIGYHEFARREGTEVAKAWMMHDASEAYLGDVVRPVKNECGEYRILEGHLQLHIERKFGIDESFRGKVKEIDNKMSDIEEEELWQRRPQKPKILFLQPRWAEKEFISICCVLGLT